MISIKFSRDGGISVQLNEEIRENEADVVKLLITPKGQDYKAAPLAVGQQYPVASHIDTKLLKTFNFDSKLCFAIGSTIASRSDTGEFILNIELGHDKAQYEESFRLMGDAKAGAEILERGQHIAQQVAGEDVILKEEGYAAPQVAEQEVMATAKEAGQLIISAAIQEHIDALFKLLCKERKNEDTPRFNADYTYALLKSMIENPLFDRLLSVSGMICSVVEPKVDSKGKPIPIDATPFLPFVHQVLDERNNMKLYTRMALTQLLLHYQTDQADDSSGSDVRCHLQLGKIIKLFMSYVKEVCTKKLYLDYLYGDEKDAEIERNAKDPLAGQLHEAADEGNAGAQIDLARLYFECDPPFLFLPEVVNYYYLAAQQQQELSPKDIQVLKRIHEIYEFFENYKSSAKKSPMHFQPADFQPMKFTAAYLKIMHPLPPEQSEWLDGVVTSAREAAVSAEVSATTAPGFSSAAS